MAIFATILSTSVVFRASAIGHVSGPGGDEPRGKLVRCEHLVTGEDSDFMRVLNFVFPGLVELQRSKIYSINSELKAASLKVFGMNPDDLPFDEPEVSRERLGNPNSIKIVVLGGQLRLARKGGDVMVEFPFQFPPVDLHAWEDLHLTDGQFERMSASMATNANEPAGLDERLRATEIGLILRDNGKERVVLKIRNARPPYLYKMSLDVACDKLENYIRHPELPNADYLRNEPGSHILTERGFLCRIPILRAIAQPSR